MGTIENSAIAALRFEVQGVVGSSPWLVVENAIRMHDDRCPDLLRCEGGYRVIIEGALRMVCNLEAVDERGDRAAEIP